MYVNCSGFHRGFYKLNASPRICCLLQNNYLSGKRSGPRGSLASSADIILSPKRGLNCLLVLKLIAPAQTEGWPQTAVWPPTFQLFCCLSRINRGRALPVGWANGPSVCLLVCPLCCIQAALEKNFHISLLVMISILLTASKFSTTFITLLAYCGTFKIKFNWSSWERIVQILYSSKYDN